MLPRNVLSLPGYFSKQSTDSSCHWVSTLCSSQQTSIQSPSYKQNTVTSQLICSCFLELCDCILYYHNQFVTVWGKHDIQTLCTNSPFLFSRTLWLYIVFFFYHISLLLYGANTTYKPFVPTHHALTCCPTPQYSASSSRPSSLQTVESTSKHTASAFCQILRTAACWAGSDGIWTRKTQSW